MAVQGREGSTRKQGRPPFPEDFGELLEPLLKMAELSPQELAELSPLAILLRTPSLGGSARRFSILLR